MGRAGGKDLAPSLCRRNSQDGGDNENRGNKNAKKNHISKNHANNIYGDISKANVKTAKISQEKCLLTLCSQKGSCIAWEVCDTELIPPAIQEPWAHMKPCPEWWGISRLQVAIQRSNANMLRRTHSVAPIAKERDVCTPRPEKKMVSFEVKSCWELGD